MDEKSRPPRLLLLTTVRTYRSPAFLSAASKLGIEIVQGVDMPTELNVRWEEHLALDFRHPEEAVERIAAAHQEQPFAAVLGVDDSSTVLAARAAAALGLPHNSLSAAEAARDKYRMRTLLAAAGVPSPRCRRYRSTDEPATIAKEVDFPCVVKPLSLNGSRGVIRADGPAALRAAIRRTVKLLEKLSGSTDPQPFLVEDYIPGVEVALEGMLDDGRLQVLALFDKPDPLEGPFFEETIYVTPSRLPAPVQEEIAGCAAAAARALGLTMGPLHAELRVNDAGPWVVEVAGRSIGGLCSQTLRFGTGASLEELILRQACRRPLDGMVRESDARGVMMIPIPEAGMLRTVEGQDAAAQTPLIEKIEITAPLNAPLTPLPEGESYLGFIFASGETVDAVEVALREAHSKLRLKIDPLLPLLPV